MDIVKDLMDAYSEHVGLPIVLIDVKNTIDYYSDRTDSFASLRQSEAHLFELQRFSLKLNSPTIISVDDRYRNIYYVVTPTFQINEAQYFLAAGPFIQQHLAEGISAYIQLSEQQIEASVNKVQKFYDILLNKAKMDAGISIPSQLIDVLQTLGNFDGELLDFEQYVLAILSELLKIEALDFFGLAIKNEADVFVVKFVAGSQVQHLMDKHFYIGEGLLGKAVILGEDFYWRKKVDTQRMDFFNREGIFPEHLFGFPVKQQQVNAILFGGNFKEPGISEQLLYFLKYIVQFVFQRQANDQKLVDSYHTQTIFANWLDLMEVMFHTTDEKYICYKILDFCQTLNKGQFCCVTTKQRYFIYRGKQQSIAVINHQQVVDRFIYGTAQTIWREGQSVHFYIAMYGLFTVTFDEQTDLSQALYILSMMEQLVSYVDVKQPLTPVSDEAIFDLLYSSMEQMNAENYALAQLAQATMEQLAEQFQLNELKKRQLLRICSILPFQLSYLEKHIAHTPEWQHLLTAKQLIEHPTDNEEIESKLLAFVDCVVIQRQSASTFLFLTPEEKRKCRRIYRTLEENQQHTSMQMDLDHAEIEDIVDMKSVIETLHLTSREKEILYLILEGLNNHEVGEYLKISVHTVKNHVTNLFKKLNVSDRIQAMAKIYRIKYGEETL